MVKGFVEGAINLCRPLYQHKNGRQAYGVTSPTVIVQYILTIPFDFVHIHMYMIFVRRILDYYKEGNYEKKN